MDKYKNALDAAFIAYQNGNDVVKETLSRIFPELIYPELKDSEDERIRKGILAVFKKIMDLNSVLNKDFIEDAIVWLENQGENKFEYYRP